MKNKPCSKCGVLFQPVWLKNGMCGGCRNPQNIIAAVTGIAEVDAETIEKLNKRLANKPEGKPIVQFDWSDDSRHIVWKK